MFVFCKDQFVPFDEVIITPLFPTEINFDPSHITLFKFCVKFGGFDVVLTGVQTSISSDE